MEKKMNLEKAFDINDLPVSQNAFEPIPAGIYPAEIAAAEFGPTKDGLGEAFDLRWKILGENYSNRVIFNKLNVKNHSKRAEEIGNEHLRSLMSLFSISKLTNTDQLVGRKASIKVSIKPENGEYSARNEVKAYWALAGSADAPSAVATSAPAWARK